MPRLPTPAPGLLALTLALGLLAAGPPAARAQGHAAEPHAPAAAPDAAAHGEGGGGAENPIAPQPSLAIWTVVVFLGLLFVLGRFAWGPLLAALHQREEHLEHVLLETERARNESEQLLAEHRRRMAEAEEQVRALLEEGRRNAQAHFDEVMRKAQAEAEAARQLAERDITSARDQALVEIRTRAADLAVSVAGKVLARSLSDDDRRRLADTAIAELPANGHQVGGAV